MAISRRTVLVLGAGASRHAGYEVGQGFKAEICRLRDDPGFLDDALQLGIDGLDIFLETFRFSGIKSPDRFLEEFPDYDDAGKFCIAKVLTSHEFDDELFHDGNAGWYETLFKHCDINSTDYKRQNLSVITYN